MSEDTKAAAATTAGAGAGSLAYLAGYPLKYKIKNKRLAHARKLNKTQEGKARLVEEAKIKSKHIKRYKGDKAATFRNWPKQLPGATLQRALGHTHAGKQGLAIQGSMALAGGAGGYAAYKKVSKASTEDVLAGLRSRITPGMSDANRAKIEDQIRRVSASGAQSNTPKPPKPPTKLNLAVKTATKRGFLVPVSTVAATGAVGYGASKYTSKERKS